MNNKLNFPPATKPTDPPQGGFFVVEVAKVVFRTDAIVAIDFSNYEPELPDREIVLCLQGGSQHIFENERADQFWHWYLTLTNQAKITPT